MVLLSTDGVSVSGGTVEEVLGPGPTSSQVSRGSVLVSIGISSTKLPTDGASSFLLTVLGL